MCSCQFKKLMFSCQTKYNNMSYKINVTPRTLHFKQPAGTSRGIYTTRQSWLVEIEDSSCPGIKGRGECAPLPDLSCDARPDYEHTLRSICRIIELTGTLNPDMLRPYPSMLFGIETAMLDLRGGGTALSTTPLSHVARKAYPSTDLSGWAVTTRCSHVLRRR